MSYTQKSFPSEENKLEAEKQQSTKAAPRRPPEVDKYVDDFLSTVCDTSRRYILELLALSYDEKDPDPYHHEKRSGEIARDIGLSAATTSEHLRQLVNAGLLVSRRKGNVVYYRLRNHKLVQAFQDFLQALDDEYKANLDAISKKR